MITCTIEIDQNIDDIHKLFLSEIRNSDRATCEISKNKTLKFNIQAKDSVSMKAFVNSILKVIQTYDKVSALK
ncbi:hypothetical protein HN789_07445 [archaeon]|jgi:tRNA threonylcarbamoyladenosine modification (KEOPS) complex  Pcc1 subunit|nr:hypothetical protein [archaeon]MBT4273153.1 hypothetical protein [archaeon]MBT4461368.1 hypothetical protein [archaeon]MBT4858886.1 hypothetical protein [archaeon]MBT5423456.1 hypothetical protein [archaeon]